MNAHTEQTAGQTKREMIAQIKRLEYRNKLLFQNTGRIMPEAVKNEREAWQLKMRLRFDHKMDLGTY